VIRHASIRTDWILSVEVKVMDLWMMEIGVLLVMIHHYSRHLQLGRMMIHHEMVLVDEEVLSVEKIIQPHVASSCDK
jgi:hypothetical protein